MKKPKNICSPLIVCAGHELNEVYQQLIDCSNSHGALIISGPKGGKLIETYIRPHKRYAAFSAWNWFGQPVRYNTHLEKWEIPT